MEASVNPSNRRLRPEKWEASPDRAGSSHPESDVVAELSRRFSCTLEHWYAEQGCNFCGWQRYERGELVDVLWGELEWSSRTDDDELPEVTGPAWIVDNVAHCALWRMKYDGDGRATARFFSDKGCRRAPLFTAPADAARHKRCLWSVSRVRPGTGRALLPLPAGVGDSVRQPVALF